MVPHSYALVELVLVFGGVAAFCWWQIRTVNKRIAARKAGRDPDAPES